MPVSEGTIVRIAARGEGVTGDGRHAPLAAPGDVLMADGTVQAGPHHAVPPCRHFPRCGGCQLQHVDDAAYADYLTGRIVGALAGQGLAVPEMRPPHLSPPRTRRRASLRAERIGRRVVIGFNEAQSHRIVDMQECHILRPELFALVAPLRALLGSMMKDRRQATVTMTLADQGVDLALEGVVVEGLAAQEALTDFAATHRLARLAIDEGYGSEARWEPEPITIRLDSVPVGLPPGAFLQATEDGEVALRTAALEAVGDAETVADLFAGLGTFALPLSARARVLAVEGARDPALALRVAVQRGQRPVAVEHRDLFRRPLSTDELNRFEAIVIDPPRAGAKEQAPALATAAARTIAYVSCNPATFARDAKILIEGGWRIDWIQPIGQFRWSTHIELAARLTR
ncbi:class I SAM-dependent RNA methyltransferase [uncultured Sphingomonas sp.]|uniref:class I SAM-dependent RNA methyltransferase n=1 Tax=uncultured Sphingomonas sp. TaxID=158754 RepID=UPI002600312F|nr:class I SAM-dependent RNA methyltransferase [uncultured Sphingomonas sp.]